MKHMWSLQSLEDYGALLVLSDFNSLKPEVFIAFLRLEKNCSCSNFCFNRYDS